MTVLQLRHANVSKFALFSSDLLLIIASPHSGQGRTGGRCETDIGRLSDCDTAYLLGSRVCISAQYKVAAKMPKAAAMSAATIMSVGIAYLPWLREHDAEKSDIVFDLNQISSDGQL